MSAPQRWATVSLIGFNKFPVAEIRVPATPHLPDVILWGNRYFVEPDAGNVYREGRKYFVPIEHMHAGAPPQPAASGKDVAK